MKAREPWLSRYSVASDAERDGAKRRCYSSSSSKDDTTRHDAIRYDNSTATTGAAADSHVLYEQ
jgi:hypothetical protein